MSFLCGCFTNNASPKSVPQPPRGMSYQANSNWPENPPRIHANVDSDMRVDEDGYSSVIPLPQYTSRPVEIHEKTLEIHMRDPPISSSSYGFPADEKHTYTSEEPSPDEPASDEPMSDASSTISFPSSDGNTSTATRETPPPPYSPRQLSPAPSSRRSMSDSASLMVAMGVMTVVSPPPMAHITPQSRQVAFRPDVRHSWAPSYRPE